MAATSTGRKVPDGEMHTKVTSYEARTGLAELLRGVLAGHSYTITVRGKPVADLVPTGVSTKVGSIAVDRMKEFMRSAPAVTGVDRKGLVDEGRR